MRDLKNSLVVTAFLRVFAKGSFYLPKTDKTREEENEKMNKKKIILGSGILLILIVAMTLIWTNFHEKPVGGTKSVIIEVVNSKNESTRYNLKTDAKYLKEAMEDAKQDGLTYEVEDGMVLIVNGEKASYSEDNAYWGFYVNGNYCNYGIDKQPVKNGDVFKIEYTKAQ